METRTVAVTAGAPYQRLTFHYDAFGRRWKKVVEEDPSGTGSAYAVTRTLTFWYDDWNPIHENITGATESVSLQRRNYLWGLDLSEALQGAGGVGGLLMVQVFKDSLDYKHPVPVAHYNPCYDGNGAAYESANPSRRRGQLAEAPERATLLRASECSGACRQRRFDVPDGLRVLHFCLL